MVRDRWEVPRAFGVFLRMTVCGCQTTLAAVCGSIQTLPLQAWGGGASRDELEERLVRSDYSTQRFIALVRASRTSMVLRMASRQRC